MSELIAKYGYVAVFIGTFLEGETVLVLGAVAAKLGILKIWLVIPAAILGSFAGDQMFFWIGRRYGHAVLERWPSWRMRVSRVTVLLERYDTWYILCFRFVYGLRSISPFVIGMTSLSAPRFLALNFLAALLWAVTIGGASFALGVIIKSFLVRFQLVEVHALLFVAVTGALIWVWHLLRIGARTRRYLRKKRSKS